MASADVAQDSASPSLLGQVVAVVVVVVFLLVAEVFGCVENRSSPRGRFPDPEEEEDEEEEGTTTRRFMSTGFDWLRRR